MIHTTENDPIQNWIDSEKLEEVLEPDLPIIDPHHHLWDLRWSQADPHLSFEQKIYFCEDVMKDINESGHNIEQTVFAQCGAFYRADGDEASRCVGETEFVQGIAAMSRSGLYGNTRLCAGIFGTADLRPGKSVESVIQDHLAASSNFRGVRTAFPSDLNQEFLEGYGILAKYNLSYDNYSPDHHRLPNLAKLGNAQPEVTIIVNHLGGRIDPDASDNEFSAWKQNISAIANCPQALMKVGGAQQRVGSWEPPFHMHKRSKPIGSEELCAKLFPYYEYAIQAFGPDRCMFESNFPVDKEGVSYRTLWNAFKIIAERMHLSDGDKDAIFRRTAANAYRLELS